jgi:uncharacterized membrane protein
MDQNQTMERSRARPKRSLSLKFLTFVMLVLSLFGWLRMQQAISNWGFLIQLKVYPGPLYQALGGILWGVLGLSAAVSLWFCLSWSVIFTEASALVFSASYWFDRLALSRSTGSQTNLYFAIGLTIGALIYTFGVSETLKRAIK